MRQRGYRTGTGRLDTQASAEPLHRDSQRRRGPRYVHPTALGALLHASSLSPVAILEPIQVRRDAYARQPGVGSRHAVSPALPGIRLDTRDAARDLLARRDHVRRLVTYSAGNWDWSRAPRWSWPPCFPSSSWLSLHIAVGHLNFLSIAYIPWILGATTDIVSLASMASRDTWRTALRAYVDRRQLWICVCRDARRDCRSMVRDGWA